MTNLRVLHPVPLNVEKAKADARLLRDLADRVEQGEVTDFVVMTKDREAFEAITNTDKWSTVALARVLDDWAVRKMFQP